MHCPAYQVWGSAKLSAPLGGEPIPRNSDVDFTIEVLECNRTPNHNTVAEVQPQTTTMQRNKCMWLHLEEADSTQNDMVLTAQEDGVAIVHHKEKTDKSQQWYWNDDGSLTVGASSGTALNSDGSRAVVGKGKTAWWYDPEAHTLSKKIDSWNPSMNAWVSSKFLTVSKEKLMPGSEVSVQMARNADAQNKMWRIEYCDIR